VEVKAGSTVEASPPKLLFRAGGSPVFNHDYCIGQYGVAANGQKFLVIETPSVPMNDGRMHVVTHWDAALPH
jgi:hypothetical protein